MQPSGSGLHLGDNWTPLARNVLVTLFAIYVVQLLVGDPMIALFAWHPFGAGFRPWQIVTAFLLGGPDPLSAVLNWLVLFFLLAPLDRLLGRKGLIRGIGVSWAVAVAVAMVLVATGIVRQEGAFYGGSALLAALLALFGFLMPGATFLLMFIVPVKAGLIAWGTGLLSFLYLLYTRDLGAALAFFSWGGAWLFLNARGGGGVRRLMLRWKRHRIEKRLQKFEVIEGGKGREPTRRSGTDDWVH